MALPDNLKAVYTQCLTEREEREASRYSRPLVRLWDAQWILAGTVKDYLALSCTLKINDIGTASLSLRPDDHLAQWIMDTVDGDTGRSVFLTVDKNGIRWSGRLDTYTIDIEKSVFTAMFNDDMEQLKYVSIWPNSFLPATVQAPKYWTLFAPIDWAIPLTFFCQFLRLSGNLWNIPDDPLDPTTWVEGITPWEWPNVCMPKPLLTSGGPWVVISSRFDTLFDLLELASEHGYKVSYRRWLKGDPMPYPGCVKARNGQCFWDIEDVSTALGETVLGGNLLTGLVRTVQTYTENAIDSVIGTVANPVNPPEYSRKGTFLFTHKKAPYVIYRHKYGLKKTTYTRQTAGAIQMVTGGHSAPGVNELIGLPIKFVGNVLGAIVPGLDTLGDIADSLLKDIYSDVFLAFATIKSPTRARQAGWNPREEEFLPAPGKSYTLSMGLALARGFYQSRDRDAVEIDIGDGAPYVVGDRGQGHFALGSRIGAEVPYRGGKVVVHQVQSLTFQHEPYKPPVWIPTLGDPTVNEMPLDRLFRDTGKLYKAARNLGVV